MGDQPTLEQAFTVFFHNYKNQDEAISWLKERRGFKDFQEKLKVVEAILFK